TPFFSGFYSKDAIIEAVGESHRWGATYAYYCVLGGVFVTALYTFRMIFMTFHGPERFRHVHGHASSGKTVAHEEEDEKPSAHGAQPAQLHGRAAAHAPALAGRHDTVHATADGSGHGDDHAHGGTPHESPAVVTIPLIALAIPSLLIGFVTVGSVLFGNYFGDSIQVLEHNNVVAEIGREFHGPLEFALHGFVSLPFWFALAGVVTAWAFFLWKPSLANRVAQSFSWLRKLLIEKYYFDWFNQNVIAALTRLIGTGLWKGGDQALIDGALVNGSAATVRWFGSVLRRVQSGYLYSYAFWMVIGLAVMLGWFLERM
ncbi:MAG: nuoL, partial [Gammaproteobacteria bacterium]|nr:nuoL [Gammaproteobacteria bacterium]